MTQVIYREAKNEDSSLILNFIKELAEYEKLLHEVSASEDDIRKTLFGPNASAFCYLAEIDNKPAGFALCFYNYSTFQGKNGIYIEDIYVDPEYRGLGIGKGFFKVLAERALRENCGRIQWWVLNWNESSINFYKKLGARSMNEWTVMRIEGDDICKLAA